MLTENTTRLEYVAQLKAHPAAKTPAMVAKITKVACMTEEGWVAYRAERLEFNAKNAVAIKATVKRLASELMRKTGKR